MLISNKDTCKNIFNHVFHNSPNWTQQKGLLTIGWMARWMGKLKEAVAIHNMDDIHGLNAEQMKPDTKEYILYDSISMKFKNRQN